MPSLTTHLLALDPPALEAATTHAFLSAAATGTLPSRTLRHWLAQDRLYALAYTNFIGTLIALVPIPTGVDRESTVEWRTVECLVDCLINIRREVKMFEDVARGEGWMEVLGEGVTTEQETRSYQDLFAGSTAMGRGLVVGMVVLWATEESYLRAWRFAKGKLDMEAEGKGNDDNDVMQKVFIPNWSSDEFDEFVARLRGLVDELSTGWKVEPAGRLWRECETAFKQVVSAEMAFWPRVRANSAYS